MMPIYLALSWFVFYRAGRGLSQAPAACRARSASRCLSLVLIPWLWMNPQMLRETVARYSRSDAEQVSRSRTAGDAAIAQLASRTLRAYVELFQSRDVVRAWRPEHDDINRPDRRVSAAGGGVAAGRTLCTLSPQSLHSLGVAGRAADGADSGGAQRRARHGAARALHDPVCRAHQRDGFRADVAGEAAAGPRRCDARSCSRPRSSSPSSISTTSRTTSSARRSITIRWRSATSRSTCSTRHRRPPTTSPTTSTTRARSGGSTPSSMRGRSCWPARATSPLDGPEPAAAPGGSFLVMYVDRSEAGGARASGAVDGRDGDQGRRPARGRRYPPEGRLVPGTRYT